VWRIDLRGQRQYDFSGDSKDRIMRTRLGLMPLSCAAVAFLAQPALAQEDKRRVCARGREKHLAREATP
jgi:hypothetical protein